ncbi:MAG: hypothetical protein MjAS7_1861 [Metallosphaera javensis (ex Sakai et al. 2022)]|nr:MAG: hypothetical protein MjAS7_1861 [Metallosphaera javensis (ex Sakai et al. 2022)]
MSLRTVILSSVAHPNMYLHPGSSSLTALTRPWCTPYMERCLNLSLTQLDISGNLLQFMISSIDLKISST